MSPSPPPNNPSNILTRFASIVGLLAAALYFTGWIYRWAYYAFFQIDVTTLNLPFESFLIVPLQVFFGNLGAGDFTTFLRSLVTIILAGILIQVTLQIIKFANDRTWGMLNWGRSRLIQWTVNRRWRLMTRALQTFPPFRPINYDKSFVNELIVVTWILAILFFLAHSQGTLDARKDAVNNTSTLPIISLVLPANNLGFGRTPDDLTLEPSPKDFRVIGDLELYEQWLDKDLTDTTDSNTAIVWRLLGDRNNKFYIFPALPPNLPPNARPPVIVIQQSSNGDQLIIISPQASPAKN